MTEPTETALRERLAELIRDDRAKGRTQKQLAADAGVSQQAVSTILTGQRSDLRAAVVARLGRALGLPPTTLGRILYETHPEK